METVGMLNHEQKKKMLEEQTLLHIIYLDFEGQQQWGEIMVHQNIAPEVEVIFKELLQQHFKIEKMKCIECYGGDDLLSMRDNNSSAFNYRLIEGTQRLSNHSFGLAIDINPVQNPYVKGCVVLPENGTFYKERLPVKKGMIVKNDLCYQAFVSRGWIWGGDFLGRKDYHHFEKYIVGINI
ncbi:MAG: M15 family metallopeptidase [Vallitaleaceae bacterium]|nr:M15 family metallopeptidase [Vallitaleaceae bacterium]